MILVLLGCTGAASARPAQSDPLEGRWHITWVRPGNWSPKEFTGTLDLHETSAGWVAAVWFDQSVATFTFDRAVVEGGDADLRWTIEDTTFQMNVELEGEGLAGEATWHGAIDTSPVTGTRASPAPAPQRKALVPKVVPSPRPAQGTLPSIEDFTWTRRFVAPQITADGTTLWGWDYPKDGDIDVVRGPPDRPSDRTVVRHMNRNPVTWRLAPDGSGIAGANGDGGVWWLSAGGDLQVLCEVDAYPRRLEVRSGEVWVISATSSRGLLVTSCALDGGGNRELARHETADDVALDDRGAPRLWVERSEAPRPRGVSSDLVQILSPVGARWGSPFRQVPWIDDKGPLPRLGSGPITMIGGGDLAWWGEVGEKGFVQATVPSDVWADATRVVTDPQTGAIDAVGWNAERLHWAVVGDSTAANDLAWLADQLGADVDVIERTADDAWWIVSTWSGSRWYEIVLFRRATRELFPIRAEKEESRELAEVVPLVLHARDGMPLSAYVTQPDETRWGPRPWPLVVQVHGGPWSQRHHWFPDVEAQTWADRGSATLAVNFRGTSGFGWEKTHGPEGAYGRGMIDDVDDAITWAIDGGWAEPHRIAMVGGSYGGDAALSFATASEPRLACAVGGLVRGNLTVPGGGLNIDSVGDAAWREAHSPDRFTHNLQAPVLVWTGGRDGENADTISSFVTNAKKNDKDVTWVRFPWEEHGLENPSNLAAMNVIVDRFLGACLGGPSWDWPGDFHAADLEVLAGVELVPGLAERVTRAD